MASKNKNNRKILFFTVFTLFMIMATIRAFSFFSDNAKSFLYVGTYTGGESEGIYIYEMDNQTGELSFHYVQKGINNPSYLAIDKSQNLLFAVSEVSDFDKSRTGAVSAFKIESTQQTLQPLNFVKSGGANPCYVSLVENSKTIFVANYTGGNVSSIQYDERGLIDDSRVTIQHQGSGPNKERQEAPHAHFIAPGPSDKYIYAVDLGIDKVNIYKSRDGEFTKHDPGFVKINSGAGPRHMAFHPSEKFAYVLGELDAQIYAYNYNPKTGGLDSLGSYPTLPADFTEFNKCADIHIHPNGNFIYASNRGHNSIVIYKIDTKTGELSFVGHESVRGDWPRNFVIHPDGKFLLVANKNSSNVVVFEIDAETGKLNFTGEDEKIPEPVCLKFY
ncbi:MAG: lactonase family protein [Melioribacteraceae bacterium]|nr:lactonase family protein [Melioribacteraceae bacterium]MCF8263035.1 lactonase family protein [Melioribacteraceae bacterium]MCF8414119.1 lactonase family protein [Melioribacteraceae bacterium]MCF8430480.1 lactonase family protein [Melioribacteraceae bacterium]